MKITSLQALEYLFKFIIASRLVAVRKQKAEEDTATFKNDLLEVFAIFTQLMGKTDQVFRGPQTNALKVLKRTFYTFIKLSLFF